LIRQLLPSEIVQQLGQVYVFSIAQSFLLVHLLKGEQVAGGGNTIFKAAHAGSLGQNILLHGGYARERFLAAFLIVVLAVGNKIAHHVKQVRVAVQSWLAFVIAAKNILAHIVHGNVGILHGPNPPAPGVDRWKA
jgi:hypothetical protein